MLNEVVSKKMDIKNVTIIGKEIVYELILFLTIFSSIQVTIVHEGLVKLVSSFGLFKG